MHDRAGEQVPGNPPRAPRERNERCQDELLPRVGRLARGGTRELGVIAVLFFFRKVMVMPFLQTYLAYFLLAIKFC